MIPLIIREYQTSDCKEIVKLFYDTIHTVNSADYSTEQLNVWATENIDFEKWNQSLQKHYSLVAVEGGKIVGFGDIDDDGYLDRLFIHKDYLRKRIATAICDMLEQKANQTITVHSSVTAKDFFIKRGYKIIAEKEDIRNGIALPFYVMTKL